MKTKTLEYGGVADAHGIESFIPFDKLTHLHEIRAVANRHRHAVIYKVEITQEVLCEVNELMESGEYKAALIYLKGFALQIGVEPDFLKSWDMIPNPDLDPYR